MLPVIPRPAITPAQKKAALFIAGFADLLQFGLLPTYGFLGAGFFADEGLDFIVVFLLIAICGFRWQIVLAFLVELVPFVGLFPTWTAFVMTLPTAAPDPRQKFVPGPPPPQAHSQPPGRVQVTHVEVRESPRSANAYEVEDAVVVPPVQSPPRS